MYSKNKAISTVVLVAVVVLAVVVLAMVVNRPALVAQSSIQNVPQKDLGKESLPIYHVYFRAGAVTVMEVVDQVVLPNFHTGEGLPSGSYDVCTQMPLIESWLGDSRYQSMHDAVVLMVDRVRELRPRLLADGMCSNGSTMTLGGSDSIASVGASTADAIVECGQSAPACNGTCPSELVCVPTSRRAVASRVCKCAWSGGAGTACPSDPNTCPTTTVCATQTIVTPHCHVNIKYKCYVPGPVQPKPGCVCIPRT